MFSKGCSTLKPIGKYNDIILFESELFYILEKGNDKFSKPLIKHKFQKLLFFITHEGLLKSILKIKSRKFQSKIESSYFVILAQYGIPNSEAVLLGVGLQLNRQTTMFAFHRDLTATVKNEYVVLAVNHLKNKYHSDDSFRACLEEFNPFSGVTPAIKLSDYIVPEWIAESLAVENIPPEPTIIKKQKKTAKHPLYLIGAGDYARTNILPNIKKFHRKCVIDYNYEVAGRVAEKYSFDSYGIHYQSCLEEIGKDKHPVVVVAGYHATHTPIALDVLNKNPSARVFIEKPPVTTEEQLQKLLEVYNPSQIFIGYNRRHIPWVQNIKKKLGNRESPLFINMTIKEIALNPNHWYFWPNQGTRITGNLCHWVDLAVYWVDVLPTVLTLTKSAGGDDLVLTIAFEDGSLVNLFPTEAGNSLRGVQERIEIKYDDCTIWIDDFLKMIIYEGREKTVRRKILRNKGHDQMYKRFQWAVLNYKSVIYSKKDLMLSSLIYLKATEMFLKKIPKSEMNFSYYEKFLSIQ